MLKEFIDFAENVLPTLNEEMTRNAKIAVTQFENSGAQYSLITYKVLKQLSQGDIISDIPFYIMKDNGEIYRYKAWGMVLSTSCSIDNKNKIVIAPVFSEDSYFGDKSPLKSNTIFDYFYIPLRDGNGVYADFSSICTYDKDIIIKGINENKINRLYSLSQLGYYLFLMKFTVCFMRKEDLNTLEERITENNPD